MKGEKKMEMEFERESLDEFERYAEGKQKMKGKKAKKIQYHPRKKISKYSEDQCPLDGGYSRAKSHAIGMRLAYEQLEDE